MSRACDYARVAREANSPSTLVMRRREPLIKYRSLLRRQTCKIHRSVAATGIDSFDRLVIEVNRLTENTGVNVTIVWHVSCLSSWYEDYRNAETVASLALLRDSMASFDAGNCGGRAPIW